MPVPGQYRECKALPPPFNHTPSRERAAAGRAERRGFCAQKHTRQLSADCRACGGPDVQVRVRVRDGVGVGARLRVRVTVRVRTRLRVGLRAGRLARTLPSP